MNTVKAALGSIAVLFQDPASLLTIVAAATTAHFSSRRLSTSRGNWVPVSDFYSSTPCDYSRIGTLTRGQERLGTTDVYVATIVDGRSSIPAGDAVLLFPFIAAACLLALYFLRDAVGMIVLLLSIFSGVIGVSFTAWPFSLYIFDRFRESNHVHLSSPPAAALSAGTMKTEELKPLRQASSNMSRPTSEKLQGETYLALTCGFFVVGAWLFTGHWLLNNFIATSLCILVVSLCRLPSLRIITALLCGLLAYDVFFVFFSSKIFGSNVMVEVAMSAAPNPVALIANALHVPFNFASTLSFPAKIMIPSFNMGSFPHSFAILGLGDVIVPSILLGYVRSYDQVTSFAAQSLECSKMPHHVGEEGIASRSASRSVGNQSFLIPAPSYVYYYRVLFAYVASLLMSFVCNVTFESAQPALVYIVPATLGTVFAVASGRGDLQPLWTGVVPSRQDCPPRELQPSSANCYSEQV